MPFGVTNAPAVFMSYMNWIFQPYLFDDILIISRTSQEPKEYLRIVISILQEKQLFAKLSKCDFLLIEVKFLGHVILKGCIVVYPSKFEAFID